jgi:hypothetical protein
MLIEEQGKLYNIDEETGLVTEASLVEDAESLDQDDFRLGSRVEVQGHAGEIVSMVPSIYGVAYGVRFDDGDFDEFSDGQLTHSAVEQKSYDSPTEAVFGRYNDYLKLPLDNRVDAERKENEARWLNENANALRSALAGAGRVDPKLDEIFMTTRTDLHDLTDIMQSVEANQTYLSSFNKYKLAENVGGHGSYLGGRDDSSWLDTVDVPEAKEVTDVDLAARATEVVSSFNKEQLKDDGFMSLAVSYQLGYLGLDQDKAHQFTEYLTQARDARLKEMPEVKTASTDFNLDDATDIFV